jgi:hypothetical protein
VHGVGLAGALPIRGAFVRTRGVTLGIAAQRMLLKSLVLFIVGVSPALIMVRASPVGVAAWLGSRWTQHPHRLSRPIPLRACVRRRLLQVIKAAVSRYQYGGLLQV